MSQTCPHCGSVVSCLSQVGRPLVTLSEPLQERLNQRTLIHEEIGPLMDAWDGLCNDVKGELREESAELCDHLDRIAYICEHGSAPDTEGKS